MRYRYNSHCSCSRCRAHGFMGPAVLITLGVLFLLDQVGHTYWMEFHNTWPALLIVIGLIMFLQHNASVEGHVPREYSRMARGVPGQPMPPGAPVYPPPQGTTVTPAPQTPAGSITPGSTWNNPNDPEVRNG